MLNTNINRGTTLHMFTKMFSVNGLEMTEC